ncbi:MAG: 1-aminocyclopropane-1-carboxylate deaminase/D-cysteine desulfhydrase, partial [Steroidobacteraceae bacterium]
MRSLQQVLDAYPRLRHALTPTPIQFLPALSKTLGRAVYCKRDDMSGFGFGGNKIRKLEFLLHDALNEGCDSLVTCGSNQSNWCRMTAAVGAANQLDVHLVLGGGEPDRLTGNLLLNRILGAHLHHVLTDDDAQLETAAAAVAANLRSRGKRPYHMIMGGSTGLGTLGYMAAMHEIMAQEIQLGVHFDAIVHATGSGGTQAGLVAGQVLGRWPGRIVGISVSRHALAQETKVWSVLDQAAEMLATDFTRADVIVNDKHVGGGYRKNTQEAET